ncbi:nuclear transport factor 2 family protein [Salinisphaera hydrothermalis]|uniref:SnoaL-like domain-containing protein n=1 Tax=Salinisphaera hydrothermalis (strain C41B8) TaxID=1304275 RepID=A0A084II41_SALHC|nr:nuclear transport factor 2 family protein [Salinisphaera hydrothermalis]KEZ76375.1 hypothetical protein C41B8_15215 [Salinisphaera hydrothermalis C41B8]
MTARKVIENYWRIECTRNVDDIMECYADDAEMVVPGMGRLSGKNEIRRFYQDSVDRFPKLSVDIVGAVEDGDQGAFEWQSLFHDHKDRPFPLEGVNVVRVGNDKLQSVHVYFDPAELG